MKKFGLTLLALLLPAVAWGQHVKLPAEVRGDPGAWVVIVPESKDGGDVKWKVGKGLTLVPIDRLFPGQKAAGLVVQAPKGQYEVWAWNAKGDVASELAVCKVIIGDAQPEPTPPGPNPPGPTPGPNPPEPPAPIPGEGLRVLFVFETAELAKYPRQQLDVMYDTQKVRPYLDQKCAKGPNGTPERRFWDKDADARAEEKHWQDALARPRALTVKNLPNGEFSVVNAAGQNVRNFARMEDAQKFAANPMPWVIVSNGKAGWEGPVPNSVEEMMSILQKYGN